MGGVAEEREPSGLPHTRKSKGVAEECETELEEEEGRGARIPLYQWIMHGAVMFGREFCYALEFALVTPVLLQIGLPEQYYSLIWFLSPVFGLLFTPLIGTTSDRCTLKWGRRRPFILGLCVGVLLGLALFFNGSLIGLSIGDDPDNQTIGIILSVVGMVVLDFSTDASEGPIRAYLLDVANTEEQDLALNIHSFSGGLGGAVGYMMGGLDWTGTALSQVFKSQEQVIFMFAGIIFTITVTLHMLSIPEQPFSPSSKLKVGSEESSSHLSFRSIGDMPPVLDVIAEESGFTTLVQMVNNPDVEEGGKDLLAVEQVRSKSGSILTMPDATIKLDPDLDPVMQLYLPEVHHCLQETQGDLDAFKPSNHSVESSSPSGGPAVLTEEMVVLEPANQAASGLKDAINGSPLLQICPFSEDSHLKTQGKPAAMMKGKASCASVGLVSSTHSNVKKGHTAIRLTSLPSVSSRPHPPSFYRQPSFTFSCYKRVQSELDSQLKGAAPLSAQPITTPLSLNDLSDFQRRSDKRDLQLPGSSLSPSGCDTDGGTDTGVTFRLLWLSMFRMPRQLMRLCLCHLMTWFSIIAQSVYYTDFMGQVVYHGDPTAPANSTELSNYNKGVQMGCWGMVANAVTSAVCSAILLKYLDKLDLSIKVIYIIGTLVYSIGAAAMAIFPNVYVAVIMIGVMGSIFLSISYCPYALLGQYHEIKEYVSHSPANTRRGFGIDCAILTCQVYISQILVASALGALVDAAGSVRVVPAVASGGSFLAFLTACFFVIYPDVEPNRSEQKQGLVGLPGDSGPNGEKTNDQSVTLLKSADGTSLEDIENHSVA